MRRTNRSIERKNLLDNYNYPVIRVHICTYGEIRREKEWRLLVASWLEEVNDCLMASNTFLRYINMTIQSSFVITTKLLEKKKKQRF